MTAVPGLSATLRPDPRGPISSPAPSNPSPPTTFDGRPIRDEYLIVDAGQLAGTGAHSYSAGDAKGGSEEQHASQLRARGQQKAADR
jgi:hypothetical protein